MSVTTTIEQLRTQLIDAFLTLVLDLPRGSDVPGAVGVLQRDALDAVRGPVASLHRKGANLLLSHDRQTA